VPAHLAFMVTPSVNIIVARVRIEDQFLCLCFSLSHSTVSMSSGSSLGSLASTGSQGSQISVAASLSDIYLDPCQRLMYEVPEIDRDALFQRVQRVLSYSDDNASPNCSQFDDRMSRIAASANVINSSSDVASNVVGCLPTYEQHLERQTCNHHSVTLQNSQVELSNSLQALGLGPFTSQLIASTSADCWQPTEETVSVADDCGYPQSAFNDVSATQACGCLGQSDASSGVSAEGASGSDCGHAGEVNCNTSRHLSSSSAAESDSGICDASIQQ